MTFAPDNSYCYTNSYRRCLATRGDKRRKADKYPSPCICCLSSFLPFHSTFIGSEVHSIPCRVARTDNKKADGAADLPPWLRKRSKSSRCSPPVPLKKEPVHWVSETARPKDFVTCGTQCPPVPLPPTAAATTVLGRKSYLKEP